MDAGRADDVATVVASVSAYGSQISRVFHSYSLIAETIPGGFEGSINIIGE
jgi:hypothetical protein